MGTSNKPIVLLISIKVAYLQTFDISSELCLLLQPAPSAYNLDGVVSFLQASYDFTMDKETKRSGIESEKRIVVLEGEGKDVVCQTLPQLVLVVT